MFRGTVRSDCDDSGIPGASCNPKYVYDSSVYSRYKRLYKHKKHLMIVHRRRFTSCFKIIHALNNLIL